MPLSPEEQERQRVARLRQQQIGARDPGPSKIRGYDWGKAAQRTKAIQKKKQRPFIAELFDVFPTRWKGVIYGLLLSIVPTLVIIAMTQDVWRVLALLPPLIFGIGGWVLGSLFQEKIE
jgi:hypothetical protein